MLFRIETDLHISDLLKSTNDVTCDILIYPHTFKYLFNGTETKIERGYFVELSGLGQLVAFAERMSGLTVSIRPIDMHSAMSVDCDVTEEEYTYAPTLVVRQGGINDISNNL